jgi:hypothetical protein
MLSGPGPSSETTRRGRGALLWAEWVNDERFTPMDED